MKINNSLCSLMLFLSCLLIGCSTIPPKYSISEDVSTTLNNLSVIKNKVNVGQFTANSEVPIESFWCRGQVQIEAPNKSTYTEYIRKAFITELRNVKIYDQNAPIVLTGNIESLNVSSIVGAWDISIQLNSSNGKSIIAKDRVEFSPGLDTIAACDKVANTFMLVTQGILEKLVNNPNFKELLYENVLISPIQNDLGEVKSEPKSILENLDPVKVSHEILPITKKEISPIKSTASDASIKQANTTTKVEIVAKNMTNINSQQTTTLPVTGANKNTLGKLSDCIGEYNSISWTECNGKKIDANGISYIGAFKNGKENGYGTKSFPDGRKFVGFFKLGYRTSTGKEYGSDGSLVSEYK